MCHCFRSVDELSTEEREEIRAEHDEAELRAAYSDEDLRELGLIA